MINFKLRSCSESHAHLSHPRSKSVRSRFALCVLSCVAKEGRPVRAEGNPNGRRSVAGAGSIFGPLGLELPEKHASLPSSEIS